MQGSNGTNIKTNDYIRYQDLDNIFSIDYLGTVKEWHGDFISLYITKSFNEINKHLEGTVIKLPVYNFFTNNKIWIVKV